MFGFHEKRRLKKFFYSKPFLAFMLLPVGFMSFVAYSAYEKEQEVSERRAKLAAELAALEERAEDLERDIETLENPYGIEKELRSRYEVGKEGEEAIVFVEREVVQEPTQAESEKEKGMWARIFDIVF